MVLVKPISWYGGTYWYPQEAEVRRWGVQVHLELHSEILFQTETYSYSGEARPSLGSPARQGPLTELVSVWRGVSQVDRGETHVIQAVEDSCIISGGGCQRREGRVSKIVVRLDYIQSSISSEHRLGSWMRHIFSQVRMVGLWSWLRVG